MVMLHIHGETLLQWQRFGVASKMVGWHSLVYPRSKGTLFIITLTGRKLQIKVCSKENVTSYKHTKKVYTLIVSDFMVI